MTSSATLLPAYTADRADAQAVLARLAGESARAARRSVAGDRGAAVGLSASSSCSAPGGARARSISRRRR